MGELARESSYVFTLFVVEDGWLLVEPCKSRFLNTRRLIAQDKGMFRDQDNNAWHWDVLS